MDNRRLVYLETEEINNLLSACPSWFRKIVETFILTGLRRSELFHLRWDDIDSLARTVHILKPKTGKARELPVSPRLDKLLRSIPRHISSPYVFCKATGEAYRDLRESLKAAVKEADLEKHVTLHTLRHTFASQMVMAGVDLLTVSELLGHSSLEMTQRYAHLSPGHKARAMALLEEHLEKKSGTYLAPKQSTG